MQTLVFLNYRNYGCEKNQWMTFESELTSKSIERWPRKINFPTTCQDSLPHFEFAPNTTTSTTNHDHDLNSVANNHSTITAAIMSAPQMVQCFGKKKTGTKEPLPSPQYAINPSRKGSLTPS
jgi:hypothetical protein